MERVLLSGFEPFGGVSHNSSWDVVEQAAETITGAEVHTVLLPVEFRRSAEMLVQRIGEVEPDVVITVGLAAGTGTLRLERVGINLRDARTSEKSGPSRWMSLSSPRAKARCSPRCGSRPLTRASPRSRSRCTTLTSQLHRRLSRHCTPGEPYD